MIVRVSDLYTFPANLRFMAFTGQYLYENIMCDWTRYDGRYDAVMEEISMAEDQWINRVAVKFKSKLEGTGDNTAQFIRRALEAYVADNPDCADIADLEIVLYGYDYNSQKTVDRTY